MSSGGDGHNWFIGLLVGGLVLAYAALSHYISVLPGGSHWAALVAVVPPLVMLLDIVRRSCGSFWLAIATLLSLTAAAFVWPLIKGNIGWVYFLQHVAINGMLGLVFGRTLIGSRQPLCTFFASFVQPRLSPAVVAHTRRVTLAWTIFFFAMVATSTLLFSFASIETWSIFANLLTMPLVGLMFVLEFQVRKFVLPPEDRLGITSAFRAYQAARKARQP